MAEILRIDSASEKIPQQDTLHGVHDVRYLELAYQNRKADTRFHVCLRGSMAECDWQPGDLVMVELSLKAYKTNGEWHYSHQPGSIELIDIDIKGNNLLFYDKEKEC